MASATSYTMGTYETPRGRARVLSRLPFPNEDTWILIDYITCTSGPAADLQVAMTDIDFRKAPTIADPYIAESAATGRPTQR